MWLQGFRPQAMAVTCDPEHKFELALQLGDLKIAYQLAKETEVLRGFSLLPYVSSLNLLLVCCENWNNFGDLQFAGDIKLVVSNVCAADPGVPWAL